MMQVQLLCLLLAFSAVVKSDVQDMERKFDELFQRMTVLEERDVVNQNKISALESKIATIQNDREDKQMKNVERLPQKKKYGTRNKYPTTQHGSRRDLGLQEYSGQRRAIANTKVAFYAIAADHDFHNMHFNTNLYYTAPFTNIGNSFNNSTGTFTAPVKGTYVFFATVGGNIGHFNFFYIDVNGKMLAKIFMGSTAGQASQTVIATLRAGDAVSVKSGQDDNGAYREYYTSMAGFLLYENYHLQPVGK